MVHYSKQLIRFQQRYLRELPERRCRLSRRQILAFANYRRAVAEDMRSRGYTWHAIALQLGTQVGNVMRLFNRCRTKRRAAYERAA